MKTGLPVYNTLRFIDVRLFDFVTQQWRDSISHLVEHFIRAECYLTYDMPQSIDTFARDSKLIYSENLKAVSIQGFFKADEKLPEIDDLKFPLVLKLLSYNISVVLVRWHSTNCWNNAELSKDLFWDTV